MGNLFAELKRRHIYRVAAAYAVVAWVLLQLFNNLAPILKLPDWAGTLVLVLLIGGFPIILLFAWTLQFAGTDGAAPSAKASRLDWALIAALVAVIALVSYQQLAPSQTTRTQEASVAPGATNTAGISVAVLPFVNLSGDAGQEFFSDGMTEEITSALANVQSLKVIGRSSAFQFKGQNKDLRAVGQALGASHLIEGSVRKTGDRVRISAQLVQADNGVQLWSQNYDRRLTDIFATQEDIAQSITASLRVPLGLAQGDTLVRDRTGDFDSYDQYLRAKALYRARATADAITALEKLLGRDPNYAAAWALLAQAYVLPGSSPISGGTVEEARRGVQSSHDKAERAAREAIRLDSRNALAYAALARAQSHRSRWAEAEDLYKQALMLDPGEPDALADYSTTLGNAGRLREAVSISEKVHMLEPFVPAYTTQYAFRLQQNGRNAPSIPILEALPQNGSVGPNSNLAQAYATEGRYAEAADRLLLITENQFPRRMVEDAARLLRTAPTTVKDPASLPVLEYPLDFVYAYVGAFDRALEGNERVLEVGFNVGANGLWHPVFAPLRKTERFKTFVRKAGLVDFWKARGWPDLCKPAGTDDFVCD